MAANTNVKVTITGDSSGAERAFKSATAQARAMQQQLEAQQRVMSVTGTTMMVMGAAAAAGLGLAARAAVQWESAFAGVRKTVSGSEKELAAVEGQLRAMAKSMPATHTEIAAVAEAAGQLGIKTKDITGFTKVMIDLGETTNLSATEAATALARFSNIMGTSSQDVGRLGSTIVALGNNSATTEAEIVNMAMRIAGAGSQIGLSESQVLGFSAALSSVGIEAEAGGSAFSQAMIRIEKAVRAGGTELEGFAEVAGMTSAEFATAYRDDAGGAIVTFVEGLGRIKATGGDTFTTLDELGLTGIRLQDALLRSSSAGDMLRESLDLGSVAWDENAALLAEAEQRYGTTEAKMQIARNAVNDLGISLGTTLLPALGEVAENTSTLLGVFSGLPAPVQEAVTALGVAAAAVGLVGGAAVLALPKVQAFQASLALIGPGGQKAANGLGYLLRAAGPIGLALTAVTVIGGAALNSWINQKQAVEDYASSLDAATGAVTENTRVVAAKSLQDSGALEAAKNLGLELSVVTDAALGNADAMAIVSARTEEVIALATSYAISDAGGMTLATDDAAVAARGLAGDVNVLSKEIGLSNETLTKAQIEARELAEASEETATATDDLGGSLDGMATEGDAAEAALSDLKSTLQALLVDTFSVEQAQDALESQILSLTDQVKSATEAGDANAQSLVGNSEAALANREAMRGMVAQAGQVIEKMTEQGASSEAVAAETQRLKDRINEAGAAAGLSAEETARYSGQLDLLPENVSVSLDNPGMSRVQREAELLAASIAAIPRNVNINMTTFATEVRRDAATAGRGLAARARGGPVVRGQDYLVGEEGPEIMRAATDGYVIPAGPTARILAGGYGVPSPAVPVPASAAAQGGPGGYGSLLHLDVHPGMDRREWVELGRAAADAADRRLAAGVRL